MKKVVEFKVSEESFKKYLEERLNEEKVSNRFTIKSFLKYYWLGLFIIGILIIIGSKL